MLKFPSPCGIEKTGLLLSLTVCNQGETEYFRGVVIKDHNLSSAKLITFYLSMLGGRQSQAKIAVLMRTSRYYLTNIFPFWKKVSIITLQNIYEVQLIGILCANWKQMVTFNNLFLVKMRY